MCLCMIVCVFVDTHMSMYLCIYFSVYIEMKCKCTSDVRVYSSMQPDADIHIQRAGWVMAKTKLSIRYANKLWFCFDLRDVFSRFLAAKEADNNFAHFLNRSQMTNTQRVPVIYLDVYFTCNCDVTPLDVSDLLQYALGRGYVLFAFYFLLTDRL